MLKAMGLHKHHPFYLAWCNMKTRCDNPNSTQYPWYGARGVTYCDAWKGFEAFYADLFSSWFPGAVFDRIDGDRNYTPANCRWVSTAESVQNRSMNKLTKEDVTDIRRQYESGEHTQTALASHYGVSQSQISDIVRGNSWA